MAFDPSTTALTILLFALAGLALLVAAAHWLKVGKDRDRTDESPRLSVERVRSAANMTGIAFGVVGVALLWFALVTLGTI